MIKTFALAAVLAAITGSAYARPLAAISAISIDIGSIHGSAYFVPEAKGYHVVATLDTGSTPVRFHATLADGQSASVSIPGNPGDKDVEVTFVRTADGLDIFKSVETEQVAAAR